MAKYRVEFHGEMDVEADCELEACCNAAFECSPDNVRVISSEDDEVTEGE